MANDDLSLEAAYSDEEIPEETTGEAEMAAAETEAEVSHETEAEATTEAETEAATPADDKTSTDDEPWHVKAVLTEREKRQAAERERDELRKQLAERETDEKPKTSVFEDEARWQAEREREIQERLDNQRYNVSHALARREFGAETVEKAMETFKTLAATDKQLARDVFDSDLPYHTMIELVERHEKAKELENLNSDEVRERIRAEERQKLEAEYQAKLKKREGLTPSLASARSSGSPTETDSEPREERAEEVFPE